MAVNEPVSRPMADQQAVNPDALMELIGRVIADAGGALILPLALLGDRLELFSALASSGPATAGELAERTGLTERYLREWLLAMAAAGYVTYEGSDGDGSARSARYRLSPEQADAFTNPDSPGYVAGGFQNLTAATRALDRLTEAFRTRSFACRAACRRHLPTAWAIRPARPGPARSPTTPGSPLPR